MFPQEAANAADRLMRLICSESENDWVSVALWTIPASLPVVLLTSGLAER